MAKAKRSKSKRSTVSTKKQRPSVTRPGLLTEKIKPAEPVVPEPTRLVRVGRRLFASVVFGRLYAAIALVILTATTLLWGILGAQLHMQNADQLADPLLFQNATVFHNALFPGTHSFFIKWPFFWLIKLAGFSSIAFIMVTLATVVLTVATLVIILYRIERRPAVFGTLCLLLASVLLLVPPVPYGGALLPVNMAMLATRNLEYALYIGSLILILRAPNVRRRQFWLGIAGLGLLVISDKLFLALSLGGAVIGLLAYSLSRKRLLTGVMAHWLLAGLSAAALASGLAGMLNVTHVTTLVDSSAATPYTVSASSHNLVVGGTYGVLSILTNFGANPAYDITVLRDVPRTLLQRSINLRSIGYVVNLAFLLFGMWAVARLLLTSFYTKSMKKNLPSDNSVARLLSLALCYSAVVACGVYVLTNHYYPVDSRYLTVSLFAVFVVVAYTVRHQNWRRNYLVITGVLAVAGILTSIPVAIHSYADQQQALSDVVGRNKQVVAVLAGRNIKNLVGDYWRVLPIQQSTERALKVTALENCTDPRTTLVSPANQPRLVDQPFAYLLSLDKGLTDYPQCNLDTIIAKYGRPDASVLIAGTFTQPKEELLFYDHGSHPPQKRGNRGQQTLSVLQPITPAHLPMATCEGPTLMNVVAHEDDDLLFTSPDLLAAIRAGHCVRTVYLTAGDAGTNEYYWLGRQQGSEAAYTNMLGKDTGWVQHVVKLGTRQYATVSSPRGNPRISLVFLNLPDGNLHGSGFAVSHYESLERLERGNFATITSVDGQSLYTSDQLVQALTVLMQTFKPTELHTQATANFSATYPDHSDHMAAGRFAERAYDSYVNGLSPEAAPPGIAYYLGYPVHDLDINVDEADLAAKEAAFLAYAKYDGSVCHTAQECIDTPTYAAYLSRQYQQPTQ